MTPAAEILIRDFRGGFWPLRPTEGGVEQWSSESESLYYVYASRYWALCGTQRTGRCVTEGEALEWLLKNRHEPPEFLTHRIRATSLSHAPQGALTEPPWVRQQIVPQTPTEASSPPVQLSARNASIRFNGKTKRSLTSAQYDVIQALIEAWPGTLTKDELDRRSGHTDARKILSALARQDEDWSAVIKMAGRTGGGYGLRAE